MDWTVDWTVQGARISWIVNSQTITRDFFLSGMHAYILQFFWAKFYSRMFAITQANFLH